MTFYAFAKFVVRIYYRLFFRVVIEGEQNIPVDTGYLVCPNHLSMHDPAVIGAFFPRMDLHAMSKKEAFDNPLLKIILPRIKVFPVNRGESDITAIKKAFKILKSGEGLLIFPEGTRNKSKTGVPLEAKAGTTLIAIKSKVPVVPVTIDSKYKLFSKIRLIYHKPIYFHDYYGQKLDNNKYQELSQNIIQLTYDFLEVNKGI